MRNARTNAVVDGAFQVMRDDNDAVLGVVGNDYEPVQCEEFFGDIADQFVDDGAEITRCSYIHRKDSELQGNMYMNLRWPVHGKNGMTVVGDIVGRTAIIKNSFDGRSCAQIKLMLLQLACLNGMTIPVPGFSFSFNLMHTKSVHDRIDEAQKILAKAPRYFEYARQAGELLARENLTRQVARNLIVRAIDPKNEDSQSQMTTNNANRTDKIFGLWDGGQPQSQSEARNGTAYGLLSAATDYADYGNRIRVTRGFNEGQQRFKSAFEGTGQRLKDRMFAVLAAEFELQKRMKEIIKGN
jgi:hypothetical protein